MIAQLTDKTQPNGACAHYSGDLRNSLACPTYTSEESTRIFQNALVFVFHRPEMGVEKTTAEIYSLITIGMMRFWGNITEL